jgi:hypothetical protein
MCARCVARIATRLSAITALGFFLFTGEFLKRWRLECSIRGQRSSLVLWNWPSCFPLS